MLPKDEKAQVFCMSLATVLRWWEVMGYERDNAEVVNTLAKFLMISLLKNRLAKLLGYTRWEAFGRILNKKNIFYDINQLIFQNKPSNFLVIGEERRFDL
jgi:hypothetical protein